MKARRWFEKAASQGHADAQVNLGRIYRDGEGVAQDYEQAWHRLEQAAEQGHDGAPFSLEQMLERMDEQSQGVCAGLRAGTALV